MKYRHLFYWAVSTLIIILLSVIPARLLIASYQYPHPQAIFTLGGGADRETFTAQFAQNYPSLEIWVSSGIPPQEAYNIFANAGIPSTRINLDYRAVDTVTNFTSLVEDFKNKHIHHVYLITSDFHIPRAQAIATIIFGSQAIKFTPVSIASNKSPESWLHILRDVGRCLLWLFTGRTGASLNPDL